MGTIVASNPVAAPQIYNMAADNQEKVWIKLALMGGGGVGKSNITLMFVSGNFKDYYDPTIEDSYMKDNFMVDEELSPLEIFDTAGQDTEDTGKLPPIIVV